MLLYRNESAFFYAEARVKHEFGDESRQTECATVEDRRCTEAKAVGTNKSMICQAGKRKPE